MTWRHQKPGHQQPWHWPNCPGRLWSKIYTYELCAYYESFWAILYIIYELCAHYMGYICIYILWSLDFLLYTYTSLWELICQQKYLIKSPLPREGWLSQEFTGNASTVYCWHSTKVWFCGAEFILGNKVIYLDFLSFLNIEPLSKPMLQYC